MGLLPMVGCNRYLDPMDKKQKRSIVRRTQIPASVSRPVVTPLMPSVVYASKSADQLDDQYEGRLEGYTYAREGHPNATVLAQKIDLLENVNGGLITSSGMGAITAMLMATLKSGDHIVAADQLYGRSLRLMTYDLPRLGIQTSFVDPTDRTAIEAAIGPKTRMLFFEVVSNPTLRISDMRAIADLARKYQILQVVDNTFTTPAAYQPVDFKADIIIHSVTKLLGGHSDVTLGYVVASDSDLQKQIYDAAVTWGFTPSPFDCWLAERGLHSFPLRFEKAQSNARVLADSLGECQGVEKVIYPGRQDHPDFELAKTVLGENPGNMVSFRLSGGREAANRLIRAMPEVPFAPTLGDVATTLSHPASSSHRGLSADERLALGITEGFFRVSVGIEDAEMLCEEFRSAVSATLN